MIVKCTSCEVEFSADASEGASTSCPVCGTDVALASDDAGSLSSDASSVDFALDASDGGSFEPPPAPPPEPAAPQGSAPGPSLKPDPSQEPPAESSYSFSAGSGEDITYNKSSKDLRFSEEVIWPTRPERRRTAMDQGASEGARPSSADLRDSDGFARPDPVPPPPMPPSAPPEPPPRDPTFVPRDRKPTRQMEELTSPGDGLDSSAGHRPPPSATDLLAGGPDASAGAPPPRGLDIDFPGAGQDAAADDGASAFDAIDLNAFDQGPDTGPLPGTIPDGAPGPLDPIPDLPPEIPGGGLGADLLSDDGADLFGDLGTSPGGAAGGASGEAFSFGTNDLDAGPGEAGAFDLDDLGMGADAPPGGSASSIDEGLSAILDPAEAGAGAPGPGFGDGEHTETFFVEASFGGDGAGDPGVPPLDATFGGGDSGGAMGFGEQGMDLEIGGRMAPDQAGGPMAPMPGAGGGAGAPARSKQEIARSMVKKGRGNATKVAILVLFLLVGVGLITSQTRVGIFGMNLILGEDAPSGVAQKPKPLALPTSDKLAPSVAVQAESAAVAQGDTLGDYRKRVTELEGILTLAKTGDEKTAAKKELLKLMFRYQGRFKEQFKADPKLVKRLSDLQKEMNLMEGGEIGEIQALAAMASDDPETAKRNLERLMKTKNADAEHLVMFGNVEMDAENYNDAIFYFKEAVKKAPDSTQALFNLGRALRLSGSLDGAKKIFEEILRKNKQHLSSVLELAHIHVATGNLGKATQYCMRADKKAKEVKDLTSQFVAHRLLASIQLKKEDLLAYKKELEITVQINPNDEPSLLDLAGVEDKLGNSEIAVKYLLKYHERNKKFSEAFYDATIRQLLKLENGADAKTYATEAIARYPDDPNLQLLFGATLRANDEGFAAREVYERVVTKFPQMSSAYLSLAAILRQQEEYETAVEVLRKGIETVEAKETLYKALVEVYFDINDLSNATTAIEEVLLLNPRDNQNRLLLAEIFVRRGYLEKAEGQYETLYRNGFIPDRMILAYASVLRDRGKFDKALRELELLREKNPDSVEVLVRIASVLVEKGENDKAQPLFDRCIELQPSFEPTYYYMGRMNERGGKLKIAADNYRRALLLDPNHTDARFRFAKIVGLSKKTGDVKEAIKHLSFIVTSIQNKKAKAGDIAGLVFLERGQMYFRMKLFRKALADFEQAISLDPTNIDTLVRYGQVLITDDKLDEARVYLTEAIAKNERFYEAYYHLGRIFAMRRKPRAAQKYLEISLKGDTSKYPQVHKMLGLMYRDRGLKPLARRELKKYLRYVPKGYDRPEIEALLRKI